MMKNSTDTSSAASAPMQSEHAEAIIALLIHLVDASNSDAEAKSKTKEKVAIPLAKVMGKDKAARLMGMSNNRFYEIVNKEKS